MAVRLVYPARLRRGAHVREHAIARDDARQVLQVTVVPSRRDRAEHRRLDGMLPRVPADAETVAVQRLFALLAVDALPDQGVRRLHDQRAQARLGS